VSLAPREVAEPQRSEADSGAATGTAAFGRLYKQHFDGLFDFVARMVRDRDLAGEIVQSTFAKAWDELREGHTLRNPKAWLYFVARNQALDELRRRSRLADEPLIYAQADPSRLADPQAVAEDNELVELVWSSAAALNPDEYSLLDLHVRRGFGAAELADELHLDRGAVYTRLSRLRRSLEDSVASTLLVRRGRDECPELAAIVAEHHGGDAITPELRQAVRDHVAHCDTCSDARRRVVSPVALFGALVPIVPLAGMREGILASILPSGHAAAAGAAGGAGAVAAARHGSKTRYLVGAGGVAAAAAVVAIALSSGTSVRDPSRATSIDHAVGVASADPTVTMRWSPGQHAHGYSVMFSRDKSVEPPARENVTGTQYTSAPLAPGRWWFILRTHGTSGGWTDTLRVGPFVITAPVARAQHAAAKAPPTTHRQHAPRKASHRAATGGASQPVVGSHGAVLVARTSPPASGTPGAAPHAPAAPKHHAHRTPSPNRTAPTTPAPGNPAPPSAPPASQPAPSPPAPAPPSPPSQPATPPPPPPPPPGDDDDDHGEHDGGGGHHGGGDGGGDDEGGGHHGGGHGDGGGS
jgi:RNA polymerase sigma factor (sigma-70 family)